MGKRASSSKATRGVSKGRKVGCSSSSNPKTNKFRSQYNSLAVIAKGGPSKKILNKKAAEELVKGATERQKLLESLGNVSMIERDDIDDKNPKKNKKNKSKKSVDTISNISAGTKLTSASFASVWSNCSNASLNEFFQVWNPNLETHKDALAVIAGLSQTMSSAGTEQSDEEYTKTLIRIISSENVPTNVLTGCLLALTFVMRKLSSKVINENFDSYYTVLKSLMEKYNESKKKTLIKSLLKCFASLAKSHPKGKEAIESGLRKKINIAIRQCKVQDRIKL